MDQYEIPHEFNQFIGTETINMEYKEFTFNSTGIDIDTPLAESYCTTNKFDFNSNVERGLEKYFKDYLPKYICGFMNAQIDGTFLIGVNDYGFVKGIPYQGVLSEELITKKIFKHIYDRVKFMDKIPSAIMKQFVDIKLIDIAKPVKPSNPINPKFRNYLLEKEEYRKKYNEFVEKTDNWKLRFAFVNQKLVELVNNIESRILIKDFIRRHDPTNPVISLLDSDYQMESNNHDEICLLREKSDNAYYWVCLWKDEMIDYIRSQRPVFNEEFNSSIPANLIVSAYEMIPYWVTYNENMKLYVIQVQILYSEFKKLYQKILTSILVSYIDKNKKLISCLRIVLPNGDPICIPKHMLDQRT